MWSLINIIILYILIVITFHTIIITIIYGPFPKEIRSTLNEIVRLILKLLIPLGRFEYKNRLFPIYLVITEI